jgi:hypothetical protein
MDGEPCLPTEALLTTGSLRQACASWTSSLRHRALYLRRLWADRGASGALHEIAAVDGRSLACGVSSTKPHTPRLRVLEPDLLSRGVWLFGSDRCQSEPFASGPYPSRMLWLAPAREATPAALRLPYGSFCALAGDPASTLLGCGIVTEYSSRKP